MADTLFKRYLAEVQDGARAMKRGEANARQAHETHDAALDLMARAEEVEANGGARHADKVERAAYWHDTVDGLMREMGLVPREGGGGGQRMAAAPSDASWPTWSPGQDGEGGDYLLG